MQYRRNKLGEPISILGYGCMRFSKSSRGIDIAKAKREIKIALEAGVNYFDTAYIYPGSESALGEILSKFKCRKKVNIATKLPQYLIRKGSDLDKYFAEELRRLQTDYVDYYLMHMLTDVTSWKKLQKIGITEWIRKKKSTGQIRNIGFSFHGSSDIFIELLDVYDWDFCQIQYNYMDEYSQAGKKGLTAAKDRGIPVIIMEPLRGGKLVNMLPKAAKDTFAKSRRGWSPAEWGLRWLWNQSGVTCVLSGMNSEKMVRENCRIAASASIGDLTREDLAVIEKAKSQINAKIRIPCTGCGYCMPCPKGVDIPATFRYYNEMFIENKRAGRLEYWQVVSLRKKPAFASQCISCGRCEKHCPQAIAIRDSLKEADKALRPPHYKLVGNVVRWFMFR